MDFFKNTPRLPRLLHSLQFKFLVFSLLLAVIPILIVGGVTYRQYRQVLSTRVSQSNYNTVQQKADNMDFIINEVKKSSLFLLQNHDLLVSLRVPAEEGGGSPGNKLKAEQLVREFIYYQQYIYSIYMKSANGFQFDSAFADNFPDADLFAQISYDEYELARDVLVDYIGNPVPVIAIYSKIFDIRDFRTELAAIKINIPEQEFSRIYADNSFGSQGSYYLLDPDGIIVSSTEPSQVGQTIEAALGIEDSFAAKAQGSGGYFDLTLGGHAWHITYNDLSFPGWTLVNTVSYDLLYADTALIETVATGAIGLSLLISLLFILFFTLRVLGPLKKIRAAMSAIGEQNFKVHIPVSGQDEIAQLSRHFNTMSARLDELINEVYVGKISQREAELRALQAQINPHFLYNTLDTIYWMCQMDRAQDAASLVQNLSRLFRLSLNSGNEITTVRREVELLKNYIEIQKRRYENAITFSIEVDENALECRTIKLVLQPLVENAIIHGIEKSSGQGNITVRVAIEDSTLVYHIQDDGAGADPEELDQLLHEPAQDNRGFGISSVNERIQLHFSDAYGITFKTEPGMGTDVLVRQPCQGGPCGGF
jgi:two-component system sensor histidine kinase YesM